LLGVGGSTNLLVAVGDGGTVIYSPNILTNIVITNASGISTQTSSSLGVFWHSAPAFTSYDLQAVAVFGESLYVIAGAQGSVFTSADGITWAPQSTPTTNFLSALTEWPGGLIAAGDNGTLLSSPDGKDWSSIKPVTGNWLYKVRWLNHALLAVGQQGTILTSTNGIGWSVQKSGTQAWLSDAVFIQDTWFVIGHNGTVLSSTDLVNWISRGTITLKSFFGAATDSQQLVCVGVEGIILRSPVVPELTPVSVLNYSRVSTNNTAFNLFLFGGKPDQRFTLDRSTNLLSAAWAAGPLLDITDGSGTLYYIETLTGTNLPPTEYYRAVLTEP
jgi:hypothetical protein